MSHCYLSTLNQAAALRAGATHFYRELAAVELVAAVQLKLGSGEELVQLRLEPTAGTLDARSVPEGWRASPDLPEISERAFGLDDPGVGVAIARLGLAGGDLTVPWVKVGDWLVLDVDELRRPGEAALAALLLESVQRLGAGRREWLAAALVRPTRKDELPLRI